jgi:hypothetical protein
MLVNAPPFVHGFILLLSLLWWTGCSGVSHQTQNKLNNNNKSGEVAEQGPKHVTRPEPPTGSTPVFKSEALHWHAPQRASTGATMVANCLSTLRFK